MHKYEKICSLKYTHITGIFLIFYKLKNGNIRVMHGGVKLMGMSDTYLSDE